MPVVFREHLTQHTTLERPIGETLARGKTAFQSYHFWKDPDFGVCIALDGDIQSVEADVDTYHEALVHPAMLLHPNPKNVLICGGGEGATAYEVLRHPSVEKVVMCDIDKEFVDLCKAFVPSWSQGAFEDPRLEVRYEDIVQYIHNTETRFDVVIGDLVDLAGDNPQVESLYGSRFFEHMKAAMRGDAIFATQASAIYRADLDRHKIIRRTLEEVFGEALSYRVTIPSFFAPWGFSITGQPQKSPSAWLSIFEERMQERDLVLKAFDAASLASTFFLPPHIRQALKK